MPMQATVEAHPNIALIKYWGKRDTALNLPAAGSLSVTLAPLVTRTTVTWGGEGDSVVLNGRSIEGAALGRYTRWFDLIRAQVPGVGGARVTSVNDFPTAAGLASSASGWAALAVAATRAAGMTLATSELSVLARRGSGSAARSVEGGFVRMDAGVRADGTDAFAHQVAPPEHWPELRVVIGVVTEAAKDTLSTEGMEHTAATSLYYRAWVESVPASLDMAEAAVRARDWDTLGTLAEASALQMHASALAAVPGVLYWRGATVELMHAVRRMRQQGLPAFFTIDAGPHVKVFTTADALSSVREAVAAVPGVIRTLEAFPGGPCRPIDAMETGP
jgi:diphosphomevalonate decarboxylase